MAFFSSSECRGVVVVVVVGGGIAKVHKQNCDVHANVCVSVFTCVPLSAGLAAAAKCKGKSFCLVKDQAWGNWRQAPLKAPFGNRQQATGTGTGACEVSHASLTSSPGKCLDDCNDVETNSPFAGNQTPIPLSSITQPGLLVRELYQD
jgi:hypothetical protein